MSFSKIFDMAGSGMSAHLTHLNTTASNLANANHVSGDERTVYKARKPIFAPQEQLAQGFHVGSFDQNKGMGVRVVGIVESTEPVLKKYDPSHPKANAEGYVFHSNVNTIEEMTDMIIGSQGFEICVEFLNTQKDLAMKTIESL